MNMMSLLLAANTSAAEDEEKDVTVCTFLPFPFIVTLIAFIIICCIILAIFFGISDKAGKIGGAFLAIGYLGLIIGEFDAGHTGHGIVTIIFTIALIVGIGIIGLKLDGDEKSKTNIENKTKEDQQTSNGTVTAFEFNNSVNNGNNGQNKHSATSYETITEDDLKKVNGNNS